MDVRTLRSGLQKWPLGQTVGASAPEGQNVPGVHALQYLLDHGADVRGRDPAKGLVFEVNAEVVAT